jgi:hypothetical protein
MEEYEKQIERLPGLDKLLRSATPKQVPPLLA